MSDSGGGLGAVLGIAFVVALLVWAGMEAEESKWERMIVDEPGTVSIIRSRVLAERSEEEARDK